MSDDKLLYVLTDIRNWVRASSYNSVKALLQEALPDVKSRNAYQMLDGTASIEQVRVACKMSPNALVALAQKCTAMGLMDISEDKKRVRLFDLTDFDMIGGNGKSAKAKE
jgi:hypothetical protein